MYNQPWTNDRLHTQIPAFRILPSAFHIPQFRILPIALEPLLLVQLCQRFFSTVSSTYMAILLKSADNQFGFKKGSGWTDAIHSVRIIINHFIHNGSTVNLCVIDLFKTFDKVYLSALLNKLMTRNLPCELLSIIEPLCSDCFTCVKWFIAWSLCFNDNFGVRQGLVLAHFLFALYVDNLANLCSPQSWFIILYADDILLITLSVIELERLFRAYEAKLFWLRIAINYKKSCCLRIGPRCDVACVRVCTCSIGQTLLSWPMWNIFA